MMSATLSGRSMRMLAMMALFALVMGWATTYSYGMPDDPEDVDNTPIQAGYAGLLSECPY